MEENRLDHVPEKAKTVRHDLSLHIDYRRKQIKQPDDDLNREVAQLTAVGQIRDAQQRPRSLARAECGAALRPPRDATARIAARLQP